MGEYIYTENDFDKISWERIDNYIEKIYMEVSSYLKKNNLKIKYIVPILRGGGIPAMILSHKFKNINILPMQLKYNEDEHEIMEIISIDNYKAEPLKEDECILLVEGNCVTGETLDIAKRMLINKFGNDSKIIYTALTLDYSNYIKEDSNIILKSYGMFTNENMQLSQEECERFRNII